MQQTDKKSERYKKWEIESIEKCYEYISMLEERKENLSKSIGMVSIAAFILLAHAISCDNIITLILGLIQGARAWLGLTGVTELNDRIKFLNEVKEEYEKNKNIEKDNYDMTEDNGE